MGTRELLIQMVFLELGQDFQSPHLQLGSTKEAQQMKRQLAVTL